MEEVTRHHLEAKLLKIFGPDDPTHSCGYCEPNNWATINGRYVRLHPVARCPQCNARLMLGNPQTWEWHCSMLQGKPTPEWIAHYEASQQFEQPR